MDVEPPPDLPYDYHTRSGRSPPLPYPRMIQTKFGDRTELGGQGSVAVPKADNERP